VPADWAQARPHAATITQAKLSSQARPHAATVTQRKPNHAARVPQGTIAGPGVPAGRSLQAAAPQRPRRASAAGTSPITVVCWNLEHLRADKQLDVNIGHILTQLARVEVAFFLEAKDRDTAAAFEKAVHNKANWFAGAAPCGTGEVVIYAAQGDKVESVRALGRVNTGGETRDPVLFEVKLKAGATYNVAAWHAPGPTTTSVQDKLRSILRRAYEAHADLFIGDINVAGRDRSEGHMVELTPDQSSTITETGPTNKAPIDRVWYNDETSISTNAWFGGVPGDNYRDYKGSISNHLPLYIQLWRLKSA